MVKKNIKKTIEKHNLINAEEHIVIGLSGGPDSVCLFDVLTQLSEEMHFTLHAVHVNHGFRPGAAEEDQQYAQRLCDKRGIDYTSFIYDCNTIATEEGLTSEEAGRKVRYESFLKAAESLMRFGTVNVSRVSCSKIDDLQKVPAEKIKIAVAQNADDQAETVLFRLLRGTGTDGLAGMAYCRMEQNIQIIRPLLDTWRKDIEEYCAVNGLEPRIDHTNLQPIYTRNKIRLELIPYLQENYNANIMEALGRLSRNAGEDKEYLWQQAEAAHAELEVKPGILNQKGLTELVPAVRHRVIMKALQQQGLTQDVTHAHLEAADSILDATGESRTVEFPDGYRMSVRYGEVAFYNDKRLSSCGENADTCGKYAGFFVNVCQIDEIQAKCHMKDGKPIKSVPRQFDSNRNQCQSVTFDYDKITALHGNIQPELRTRRPGDYIAIKGGRKKIQNLLVDMKVPKECRDNILMAAVGNEILWIPQQPESGVKKARYNHRCKLDIDTKNCLLLEINCEI